MSCEGRMCIAAAIDTLTGSVATQDKLWYSQYVYRQPQFSVARHRSSSENCHH